MLSANNAPSAAQSRWWGELSEMGCIITGNPAEIDHCIGASAMHNGEHIGQWWVLALAPNVHRLMAENRTTNRRGFCRMYGSQVAIKMAGRAVEKELFFLQCVKYMTYYKKNLPFEWSIMQAIMSYAR